MKRVITAIAIVLFAGMAAGLPVFSADVTLYRNGSASLNSFNVTEGTPSSFTPGSYSVRMLDPDGETLFNRSFGVGFAVVFQGVNASATEPFRLNKTRKVMRLPYYERAEKIQIRKQEEILLEINIPDRVCKPDGYCSSYCLGKQIDPDCEYKVSGEISDEGGILSWFKSWIQGFSEAINSVFGNLLN